MKHYGFQNENENITLAPKSPHIFKCFFQNVKKKTSRKFPVENSPSKIPVENPGSKIPVEKNGRRKNGRKYPGRKNPGRKNPGRKISVESPSRKSRSKIRVENHALQSNWLTDKNYGRSPSRWLFLVKSQVVARTFAKFHEICTRILL